MPIAEGAGVVAARGAQSHTGQENRAHRWRVVNLLVEACSDELGVGLVGSTLIEERGDQRRDPARERPAAVQLHAERGAGVGFGIAQPTGSVAHLRSERHRARVIRR